jgi:hypothetical protein
MAAETLLAPTPVWRDQLDGWATVCAYRATKSELVVLELFGFQDPASAQMRVLAYVRNPAAAEARPPQEIVHVFPNTAQATRFVDEAILCFEYLGCIITSEVP